MSLEVQRTEIPPPAMHQVGEGALGQQTGERERGQILGTYWKETNAIWHWEDQTEKSCFF